MSKIVNNPDHGADLTSSDKATEVMQLFIDELTEKLNSNLLGDQVQFTSYTVATLPSAATAGGQIFVSDETGGAVTAFSDGTNWRRSTDRVIVS